MRSPRTYELDTEVSNFSHSIKKHLYNHYSDYGPAMDYDVPLYNMPGSDDGIKRVNRTYNIAPGGMKWYDVGYMMIQYGYYIGTFEWQPVVQIQGHWGWTLGHRGSCGNWEDIGVNTPCGVPKRAVPMNKYELPKGSFNVFDRKGPFGTTFGNDQIYSDFGSNRTVHATWGWDNIFVNFQATQHTGYSVVNENCGWLYYAMDESITSALYGGANPDGIPTPAYAPNQPCGYPTELQGWSTMPELWTQNWVSGHNWGPWTEPNGFGVMQMSNTWCTYMNRMFSPLKASGEPSGGWEAAATKGYNDAPNLGRAFGCATAF